MCLKCREFASILVTMYLPCHLCDTFSVAHCCRLSLRLLVGHVSGISREEWHLKDVCLATLLLLLQPELYQSFAKETSHLEQYFGHLGESGSYILGDDAHGLQWHVYIVSENKPKHDIVAKPIYTLEVCMTQLCPKKVKTWTGKPPPPPLSSSFHIFTSGHLLD